MIATFIAVQFRRPMNRGLNRPFLAIAEPVAGGERCPLVVKPTAGYGDRPDAMLRELFALLLAKRLGLFTPEPVFVRFPEGLDWTASDHPEHAALIRQSPGWNLATVHLGNDWKQWIATAAPRSINGKDLESAYCYDAMIQNSDREANNPNLLWRENQLALLDFDKAFAFLRLEESESRPWRKTLGSQNLERHCLYTHLPELKDGFILGQDLWESFEEWWVGGPSGEIAAGIGGELADPDLDLPRLEEYLTKLAVELDDFFRYLTEASRA